MPRDGKGPLQTKLRCGAGGSLLVLLLLLLLLHHTQVNHPTLAMSLYLDDDLVTWYTHKQLIVVAQAEYTAPSDDCKDGICP